MASELSKRLAVAAIGIPVCIAVAYTGGVVFAAGLGILAYLAVGEIGVMLGERGRPHMTRVGAILAGLFPLAAFVFGPQAIGWFAVACLLGLLGFATLHIPPAELPFQTAALTFTAVLYVGGLLAFGVVLREWLPDQREGTLLFFLPVVVTWVVDTAAYTGGRAMGRRKLAPAISPNKTVEGALAGGVAAMLSVLLVGWWVGLPALHGVILGVLLALATQIGDLAASVIKRSLKLKDFGTVLGPHGGMLDTFDGFLFAAPVTWFYIWFFLMP